MKKALLINILFWLCIIMVDANTKEEVSLNKCVDGDTAVFNVGSEEIKVRFLAIDTPETVHPTKEVEAYGKDASEYTCNKLQNATTIELEYDDKSSKLDKYGRTLAWIWVDNSLLQQELIEIGYAKVAYIYGKYSYLDTLYEKQAEAKEQNLGLWQDYTPETYTVTFKNDDEETKITVNEEETVESFTPTKNGYKFIGWYLDDEEFDFDTKITSDITLTAKYEEYISVQEIIIILIVLIILYIINPKKFKRQVKKQIKKKGK
jgi:uncharacterized repeat protein (TIGR02543 family)